MKSFRLGLTGSIAMGKSTTAQMFRDMDIPVWDADAVVHRLYENGQGAVALKHDFPQAIEGNRVSRETLKRILSENPDKLARLEAIIHPLVANERDHFIENCTSDILVLDIPLLFEKRSEALCDAILLVTAPEWLQRQRVVSRETLTQAQFDMILSRQMPDREKRARADHIVETLSIPQVKAYVEALIQLIRARRDA